MQAVRTVRLVDRRVGDVVSVDHRIVARGSSYRLSGVITAPRQTVGDLDPTDIPRVRGFEAIDPSRLSGVSGRFNHVVLDDGSHLGNRRFGHIDLANGADVLAAGEYASWMVCHG